MDRIAAAAILKSGLERGCADDIVEALCNLADGTCDAIELIPLLEQVAQRGDFHFFDDNGAGGAPRPSGAPRSFRVWARTAIRNIEENQELSSGSRMADALKSLDPERLKAALGELLRDGSSDVALLPTLEKIARKDRYDSYGYVGGYGTPLLLGGAARKAIQCIRENAGLAPCSICAPIPDVARANTGRDEVFGKPITLLKRHELDRDDDLWECPECGDLFLWHDDRAQTGSGNNDTETLTRLFCLHAATLREILSEGTRAFDDPVALAKRMERLPPAARDLAERHLRRSR